MADLRTQRLTSTAKSELPPNAFALVFLLKDPTANVHLLALQVEPQPFHVESIAFHVKPEHQRINKHMYRFRYPTISGHAAQFSSNPTNLPLMVEFSDRGVFDALRRRTRT